MDLKIIGRRIKEARENKGWTQEQLAEKVDLSSAHISVIERGVKLPRFETFIDLANALDCDANTLLIDVLNVSNQITTAKLSTELALLPVSKQKTILNIIEFLIRELDES